MKTYRIAVYIRLSMEDLGLKSARDRSESCSVSNQRSFIHAWLGQHEEFRNAKIQEFVDDGYSGTNFERPAVKEMLALCRQGEIDCIVVKDLSRFGRNYLEVGDYLEQIFPFLGIRFIGINDHFDSADFEGKTGGMDVAFKNFVYEMYSRDLSKKIKSGVDICMKRGEYHAGWTVYGYQRKNDGKMIADEEAAAVVRRIFEETASGKKPGILAKELNEEGVPTRLAYKRSRGEQLNRHYPADVWTGDKISSVVRNEVYAGDMVYRRSLWEGTGERHKVKQPKEKRIIIRDHHESLVERELFELASRQIHPKRAGHTGERPAARGIVFCGCCGNRLELHRTRKPYYVCRRRKVVSEEGCRVMHVEKEKIDQAVWAVWKEHCRMFAVPSLGEILQKRMDMLQGQEDHLRQKLSRFPSEKLQLYEQFRSERITKEAFIRGKERLGSRESAVLEKLEGVKEQMKEVEKQKAGYSVIAGAAEKYGNAEEMPEGFMREMAEKITVYEGAGIEVRWRYRDEFQILENRNIF
jgi:site-specific DNA recombinase